MAYLQDARLGPMEMGLPRANRVKHVIRRAAAAALVLAGLIVATAIVAGGALAVVIAMVAAVIPVLVLPLLVILYDEGETHDVRRSRPYND